MSEISTLESTQELVAHQLIGQMREENMRLSAAVNETGRYPDWWADGQDLTSTRDIESDFKLGNGSPEDVAAYYVLTAERAKIRKELTGFDSSADQLFYDFSLGADVMAKGLAATGEDGDILRKDVLEGIANPDMDAKTELLSTVQSYYGAKRATDLLAVRGEGFDQQVRTALRTAPGIKALAYEDNKMNYEDTWKQTIEKGREWFADALATSEGIDITAAREYTFSAGVNNRGEQLAKVLNAFDHFGPERIRKISEATNIYGLEAYSIGQLERMEEFATNPQALSERLKNHDVTVVLTNRSGDYNGVMTDNSQMVEDGETSGRCLFFEMNTMDDIYRTFVKLQRAGIQPSTLWLAAHSGEGQFVVSDERPVGSKHASIAAVAAREVVAAVNESEEAREKNYFGFSLHGMKGFSRLVDTYMRDSRAIDDPKIADGRKRIVFQACHMGDKVDVRAIDPVSGQKITVGNESVISQIAKDLIASGNKSKVDIFGGTGGIQMHASEAGVRYSGPPTSFTEDRVALKGLRARIGGSTNTPVMTRVSQISMR